MIKYLIFLVGLFSSCMNHDGIQVYDDKPYNRGIHIVPYPNTLVSKDGFFVLNDDIKIYCEVEEWKNILDILHERICESKTDVFVFEKKEYDSDIIIKRKKELEEEEYEINVDSQKVIICASSQKGLFYAMQTFLQLLPAEIEGYGQINKNFKIPNVSIYDKPRFGYRGVLIDVCRHFFTVEELKKQIEIMAMLKLNYLHLHLTDNHGWRLEIDKYPELIKKSSVAETYNNKKYGPYYYTKDDMREIIAFAHKNQIEIIPEIEFPGHCVSVLVPFPELSCYGYTYDSEQVFNYNEAVFCVGNEKVYDIMGNILKEVAELFPCEYLHIGGDECAKTYWKKCPKCQSLAKRLNLKATPYHTVEEQLQSYAIQKMAHFITDTLKKKVIGWDEILEGELPEDAIVMSWRGIKGGLKAADLNHGVIMASMPNGMYLCDSQGKLEVEPASSGMFSYMKDIYEYDPIPKELSLKKHQYILGTQCCAWTEWTSGVENLEYILYPRITALAETAWTFPKYKNWTGFLKRLDNMLVRLDLKNVNYHIPIPEGVLTNNRIITKDSVELCFENSQSLPMVYTLDGSNPTGKSSLLPYRLILKNSCTLKVATKLSSGKLSKIRTINIEKTEFGESLKKELDPTVRLQLYKGLFCNETDYLSAKCGKDTILSSLPSDEYKKYDFKDPCLAVYMGEFYVPKTDVYTFSSNVDELWIANKRLVYNPTSSRFYAQKVEMYLEKGVHTYKIVFSNRLKEGFASCWYPIDFKYVSSEGIEYMHPQ